MNPSRGSRSETGAGQTLKVRSRTHLLRQDGPRVHCVPIGLVPSRASVSGSRPGLPGGLRPRGTMELGGPAPHVKGVEMLREAVVHRQAIPQPAPETNPEDFRIPAATPHSSLSPAEFSGRVPASGCHPCDQGRPPCIDRFFVAVPPVMDGLNLVSRFPYTRHGLTPGNIGERESDSHLNEARATKGIAPDNARLVAVFRRTPVELISHVRFDESRMLLLFRLVPCEGRRSTRVHDVAAVKDLATGKVHLVPHRTLYRTVLLS
jgi:hypothetical protein